MNGAVELLATGQAALDAADWHTAKGCFEMALLADDTPEAHDGLGVALWWLNEIEPAHQHRARAYQGFKERGALGRAAVIAAWLAREQVFLSANASAMQGWFARAERLLRGAGPCAERGWVIVFRASMLASPEGLEQAAQQAIAIARDCRDDDLEAFARAFFGMAHVALGHVGEGLLALDEAMAAALGGELRSFMTISEICCVMLSACELAGDLARTEQWCQVAADFARRHHCSFLAAYCRTTYGGLLTATGRWGDAEVELLAALRSFEAGHRALRVHAVLKLANLRACQGRLEEAAALLAGNEDCAAALVPLTRLHLARGEAVLARATLEQALRPAGAPELLQAPLLLLLVEALLACGEGEAARAVAGQLVALAHRTQSDLLLAQAELAEGQARRQTGDPSAAAHLHAALDRLRPYEHSLLAGRARLEMAHLLRDSDRAGAVTWARAAAATFGRLGATQDAAAAGALLRRLGIAPGPGRRQPGPLTAREAEVLALLSRGRTNGEIAARLFISAKTVEHHVSRVLAKLGARTRAEAVAVAVAAGQHPAHPRPTRNRGTE